MVKTSTNCIPNFKEKFVLLPNTVIGETTKKVISGTISTGVIGGLNVLSQLFPSYLILFLSGFLKIREIYSFIAILNLKQGKVFNLINNFSGLDKSIF